LIKPKNELGKKMQELQDEPSYLPTKQRIFKHKVGCMIGEEDADPHLKHEPNEFEHIKSYHSATSSCISDKAKVLVIPIKVYVHFMNR
jgi:hypothetical protein